MSRGSYAAQQARIERQIAALRRRAELLANVRRKPVVASIIASMHEFDISLGDIAKAFNEAANAHLNSRQTAPCRSRPAEPKYRHPGTGESWNGRGRPPRWLTLQEANGKSRDSFLIAAAPHAEPPAAGYGNSKMLLPAAYADDGG